MDAGREIGRHYVITHAYWREGGPEFKNVNIMAVAHGMEKDRVLAHKAAIDEHLREAGIDFGYTNVFWGDAAKSNRRRSRRRRIASFANAMESIPRRCSPSRARKESRAEDTDARCDCGPMRDNRLHRVYESQ